MNSFIQRYYATIERELRDSNVSKRYPKEDRLEDLHAIDVDVFEDVLKVSGQESEVGYAEVDIDITDHNSFYPLPFGFRQFITMEERDAQGHTLSRYSSKPRYNENFGVQILTAHRGFRFTRPPHTDGTATVTMTYLRGPGELHYAKASSVAANNITSGTPPTDGGTLVLTPNYYNGMELHIYKADTGARQRREILKCFLTTDGKMSFVLRHPLDPLPTGDVWYEISPTLPEPYDIIYSLDAAIAQLERVEKFVKSVSLTRRRKRRWLTAAQYFTSNVSDRGPARLRPLKPMDRLPTSVVGR